MYMHFENTLQVNPSDSINMTATHGKMSEKLRY